MRALLGTAPHFCEVVVLESRPTPIMKVVAFSILFLRRKVYPNTLNPEPSTLNPQPSTLNP